MRNKRLIINWILFLGWITFIFYMSNQSGEVSTKQSDLVVDIFVRLGLELSGILVEMATFIIRKSAHFIEYFILGIITMNLFKFYFKDKSLKSLSILFIFCYASLDEFHQYFIPGRSAAFRDVIIDMLGAAAAMLAYKFIINLKSNCKINKLAVTRFNIK